MGNCNQNLKRLGFSKLDADILLSQEVKKLKSCINNLFEDDSMDFDMSSGAPVIVNLLGLNSEIDQYLEKIIAHDEVQSTIFDVLGNDYKIWEISVRRSSNGDKGLCLHQDAPGQTNLVFSLSDNPYSDGATGFLAKSHLLPRYAHKISWLSVRLASFFVTPLRLELGEAAFFFNRTWHLRNLNKKQGSHDVIFFGLFPVNSSYTPSNWIQKNLNSWQDPILKKSLDASIGTTKLENGRFLIEQSCQIESKLPYTMQLESMATNNYRIALIPLYMKIVLLEIIFFPLKFIYRLIRTAFKRLNIKC